MSQANGNTRKFGAKPLLIGLAVVLIVFAARFFNAQQLVRELLEWISGLGPWGPVVFVFIYIAATILFIPGFLLTLGSGFLFGVVKGSILVSVASTLGATLAFLAGRYLARSWVSQKIAGNEKFKAIDRAVGREGWKIVGLVRLSPIFPFNLLNYAMGLTGVSLKEFFLASWLGMLPGTLMYVYLGSLAGDLAMLGSGQHVRTPAEWALYAVGLVATIVVTVYVTRLARSALREKIS